MLNKLLEDKTQIKTTEEGDNELNVFGSEDFKRQTCDLVTVKLHKRVNEDIQLTALASHTICLPLPTAVNIHQYLSLQDLDLADCLTANNM